MTGVGSTEEELPAGVAIGQVLNVAFLGWWNHL